MKKRSLQRGSAHVVIVVILIIIILGLLGYVFWNNFLSKKPVADTATSQTTATVTSTQKPTSAPTPSLKTYTTNKTGYSFSYPSNFSVVEDDSGYSSDGLQNINVTISDSTKHVVAHIGTDFEGGSTCQDTTDLSDITIIGSHSVTIANTDTTSPTYYTNLILKDSSTNSYSLTYGLVPRVQADGTQSVACADEYTSLTAFVIDPATTTNLPNIEFYGSSDGFATVSDAEAYIKTSEYAQIEAIIESLKIPNS